MPTINKILRGRYRVIQQLGDSETGTVFMAQDSVREANVALKEILIDLEKAPTINQRELLKRAFADEAKILAKVKHESLPQVRGFFAEVDRQYLVMELVDGEDASEILAKEKNALAVADAANWADQLLDALDYLHTLTPPIIHGNIKPQNVKLTSRGKIKLLDFGISINEENVKSANSPTDLPYSSLQQILRSIDVSAQENAKKHNERLEKISKQKIDARSDIYALGATLYHLLTGQVPTDALSRALEIWDKKPDSLPAPDEMNPAVPIEVSDVLMKALNVEREKRYASAAEMREALQTAVVEAQERETEEAKSQETAAARENLLAEEKRLEQERLSVEKERLKLEAEQKKQTELIEKQLKEAEAQRLEAEKRAADAEKRLKEAKNADAKKSAPTNFNASKADSPKSQTSTASTDKKPAFGETKSLFAEPQAEKKSSWMMPAAAVAVLLIVGAVAGMWFLRSPEKVEANQKNANQIVAAPEKAAPETQPETQTQTSSFVTPETKQTPAESSPATINETVSKTASKPKPNQTPVRVEKTAAPVQTKATPKPKKAVTVDDLIGGN